LGGWPWPRRHYATIIDNVAQYGAKEVLFDLDFSSSSNPADDEILRKALAKHPLFVTLPGRVVIDPVSGTRSDLLPMKSLRHNVNLASIDVWHNFRGIVRKLPFSFRVGGEMRPSLAAKLTATTGPEGASFPIDFAIDPRSIPTLSAVDVIEGKIDASVLTGKSVIVGATSSQLGDTYLVPGHGMMSGAYLQALGAETLLAGKPVSFRWYIALLGAVAIASLLALQKDVRVSAIGGLLAAAALLLSAGTLEALSIFFDIVPALVFLLIISSAWGWSAFKRFYRARGSVNAVSGLPNLNVLRQEVIGGDSPLVIAKVHNYAEITSALSPVGEAKLVQQITDRLTMISSGWRLYQSDEGIFAWLAEGQGSSSQTENLNAFHEIFRAPMVVLDGQIDTTVTFGVDARLDQPLASRLGSAVVAADEALRDGLKWKQYDPSRSEDIAWRISLLSQLDQAIDEGDIWVAFQPKIELATRQIVGAEALSRWNHPEKGAIAPGDFILAAEQSGRIGKLTDYVLGHSIKAAARINRRGIPFSVAVNLSARLIDGPALRATISKLLSMHKLAPHCLTLEITETAALAGGGEDLEVLKELRDMGVNLSIDDYGTGLSTLDYMKRIPASEIKIDKSFIDAIDKSRSDRLMVHSTIQLAHSLGQKVVAEGVERAETLEVLAAMGCDIAQGYLVGHPLPFEALERSLMEQRRAA